MYIYIYVNLSLYVCVCSIHSSVHASGIPGSAVIFPANCYSEKVLIYCSKIDWSCMRSSQNLESAALKAATTQKISGGLEIEIKFKNHPI